VAYIRSVVCFQMDETPPSGREHHKRCKKGARSNFDRRKNDERLKQQARKENFPPSIGKSTIGITTGHPLRPLKMNPLTSDRHHPNSAFENLKADLTGIPLPNNWQVFSGSTSVEHCQLKSDASGVRCVAGSVVVSCDMSWSVHFHGVKVPAACKVLANFPLVIAAFSVVMKLVQCVDQAVICPGSSDEEFVTLCQKRGGTIKGQRGYGETVVFVDERPVIDSRGESHPRTVRRVDCDILCEPSGRNPLRC
jgi:hypothetical protein